MGFSYLLYEARQNVVRMVKPKVNSSPLDAEKYHRAFVAGLMGLPAGIAGGLLLYTSGNVLEAIIAVFLGFFTPFSIQLGVEYSVKQKEEDSEGDE